MGKILKGKPMRAFIIFTSAIIFLVPFLFADDTGFVSMGKPDQIYQLTGNWRFSKNDRLEYASRDFDDSSWDWITVPGQWHMLGIENTEIVWYRQNFNLSEAYRGVSISIRVPVIADSHELYINGKMVGGAGKISADGEIRRKSSQPGVYHIPLQLLQLNDSNTIALRVGDDVGWGGIVTSDFFIGKSELLDRKFQKFVMWNSSIVIILLFLGVYFIILYFGRRQEKSYLHFSLLTTIGSFVLFGYFSFPYWVVDSFWFNHFIFHSGLNIAIMFAFFYAYTFFEYQPDRIFKIITVCSGLLFFILLLTPFSHSILKFYAHVTLTIALTIDFIGFIFLLYIIIKSIKLEKLGAKTIGFGGLVAILCFLNDILGYLQIMEIRRLGTEGTVIFLVCMSFAMALKFAKVYDETDRLNESLEISHRKLFKTNKTFEKFVPRQFLTRIATEGLENIELGKAQSDYVTMLFSDIRSFTELTEKMAPQDIMDFLNSYLKLMNRPIHTQMGFIDKFIGDAIMAIFDLPDLPDSEEAYNAIQAAVDMQYVLADYNQKSQDQIFYPLNIGIGIHSGRVVIGTVGSLDRMESTVLGDAVNLASRLEGLTKYYGANIIVSHETISLLEDPAVFSMRELDWVRVKGRTGGVKIYEIFDADPETSKEYKLKSKDRFSEGLNLRSQKDWKNASKLFRSIIKENKADTAAQRVLDDIKRLRRMDLPDSWDGAIDMQNK